MSALVPPGSSAKPEEDSSPEATLVACPLCGAGHGYTLADGGTFRWWSVRCKGCGQELSECRSDGSTRLGAPKPARWPAADDAWNVAGAHAQRLRDFLVTIRDTGMSAEDAAEHAADALRG